MQNKRRRASGVKAEADDGGGGVGGGGSGGAGAGGGGGAGGANSGGGNSGEVNGNNAQKVKPSPRIGGKRQKGAQS